MCTDLYINNKKAEIVKICRSISQAVSAVYSSFLSRQNSYQPFAKMPPRADSRIPHEMLRMRCY